MRKVFQIYINGTIEAIAFYQEAFRAELGITGMNDDGTYMHAEIVKDGEAFMFVSEKPDHVTSDTMQFCLFFNGDREAVTNAYKVLSKDSMKIDLPIGNLPWGPYGASLVDKFGVFWFISEQWRRSEKGGSL